MKHDEGAAMPLRRGLNYRGDEMIRGFSRAYPGLWGEFMREIRVLQVDQPGLLVRDVMAQMVRRWLEEQQGQGG